MVTTFNKKDLVSFGKYLLSEKRKEKILLIPHSLSDEERLKNVYHADVENWLGARNETIVGLIEDNRKLKKQLELIASGAMFEESCPFIENAVESKSKKAWMHENAIESHKKYIESGSQSEREVCCLVKGMTEDNDVMDCWMKIISVGRTKEAKFIGQAISVQGKPIGVDAGGYHVFGAENIFKVVFDRDNI